MTGFSRTAGRHGRIRRRRHSANRLIAEAWTHRFIDCELRARLAGFRSQSVSLANRRPMDPPDLGTILLHRLSATEGTTVSAASLAAPKDAKKAYEKGMDALKKKKVPEPSRASRRPSRSIRNTRPRGIELGRYQAAQGRRRDGSGILRAGGGGRPEVRPAVPGDRACSSGKRRNGRRSPS